MQSKLAENLWQGHEGIMKMEFESFAAAIGTEWSRPRAVCREVPGLGSSRMNSGRFVESENRWGNRSVASGRF